MHPYTCSKLGFPAVGFYTEQQYAPEMYQEMEHWLTGALGDLQVMKQNHPNLVSTHRNGNHCERLDCAELDHLWLAYLAI